MRCTMKDLTTLRRGFTALTSEHLTSARGEDLGRPEGQPTARS